MDDNAEVRYSVKELLKAIQETQVASFAAINAKLDQKADKADVDAVQSRLDAHILESAARDRAIAELKHNDETAKAAQKALTDEKNKQSLVRQWVIGSLITVALLFTNLLPYLVHHK